MKSKPKVLHMTSLFVMASWVRAFVAFWPVRPVIVGLLGLDSYNIMFPPSLKEYEMKNDRFDLVGFAPSKRAMVCSRYDGAYRVLYDEVEKSKGELAVFTRTGGRTEIWAEPRTYLIPRMFCNVDEKTYCV